jgi:hypothetical protein
MKAASISELKKELIMLQPEETLKLCLQLAKFKKENKEFLSYLLFDANDEYTYIQNLKEEIDAFFKDMNRHNVYLAKKTLQKTVRALNKYFKFAGSKKVEVEVLIYFCNKLKNSGLINKHNSVIQNIYIRHLLKARKALSTLHEDLQLDYIEEFNLLKK